MKDIETWKLGTKYFVILGLFGFFVPMMQAQKLGTFENEVIDIAIPDQWELIQSGERVVLRPIEVGIDTSTLVWIDWMPAAKTMMLERQGSKALAAYCEQSFNIPVAYLHSFEWKKGKFYQFEGQAAADSGKVISLYTDDKYSPGYGIMCWVLADTVVIPLEKHSTLVRQIMLLDSIQEFTDSLQIQTESIDIASTRAASPSPLQTSGASISSILGKWELVNQLDAAFLNAYASPSSNDVNQWTSDSLLLSCPSCGTELSFQFVANGKYFAMYKGFNTWGKMKEKVHIIEQGKYVYRSGELILLPGDYKGKLFEADGRTKPIHIQDVPKRIYQVMISENRMIIKGKCGDFQGERYCGETEKTQEVYFPLVRN